MNLLKTISGTFSIILILLFLCSCLTPFVLGTNTAIVPLEHEPSAQTINTFQDPIIDLTNPFANKNSIDIFNIESNKIRSSSFYSSHMLTETEVLALKKKVGVFDPNENYNHVVNGLGTGLTPPTEEDWCSMIGTVEVVDSVSNTNLPTFIDHSQSVYFPQVRSQGSQNSCSAWMTTYYAQGYYQAREFKWTQASTGNNNQLFNPAWTYNKVNKGYDKGSNFWRNWRALNTIGAVRWITMPYDSKDDLDWGAESAWREAPKYRAGNYIQTDVKNIDVVRAWVKDGFICPISIDTSEYDGLGVGDDTITSIEYNSTSHNHANAVVGYDDNKVVGGERGAFKIVNSWGSNWGNTKGGRNNLGGWNGNGYYWMTYKAFTELLKPVYTFYDKVAYAPSLLATWSFEGNCSRDSAIWLYLNSTSTPEDERNLYRNAGAHNYPQFLCLDVTEFYDFGSLKPIFLKVFSGANKTNMSSFKLELYENGYSTNNSSATLISPESPDVPKCTPCTVENIAAGQYVKINLPVDNNYYTGILSSSGTANYSITHTLLSEDFEEKFPGDWVVGDNDSSYGEDYWGDTNYRFKSGFKSAWCAEEKEPIFQEDFDTGGTIPSGWATRSENTTTSQPWVVNNSNYDYVFAGDDYAAVCNSSAAGAGTNITELLYTTTGFNASIYSYLSLEFLLAYNHSDGDEFAEVLYANESTYPNFTSLKVWITDTYGYQQLDLSTAAGENEVYLAFRYHGTFDYYLLIDDVCVTTNSTSNEYDHDMKAYMYHSVNLTGYEVVNLTYDYWINSENSFDSLKIMYYFNSVWYFVAEHTGSSSGWKSNSVIIPNTAEYIGFQFESNGLTSAFEGAYIDNIELTGTINLSLVEVRVDTGSWNPTLGKTSWINSINSNYYMDGHHKFTARGKYGSFESIDYVNFVIDNSPPEPFTPEITPANWSSNTQPILTFETTDAASYIDYYEVKLDSGNFIEQSSPYLLPIQTEGSHLVTVRAFDALGHYRDGVTNYFIDASKPLGFEPTVEPSGWTNNPQPVVIFSTTDSISGVQRYMLKIDDGNFSNQTSPFTLPLQTDGIHTITVRAFDQAENYVGGIVDVYIDTVLPDSLNITPKQPAWSNDNTPELTFSATDSTSGVAHYELRIDTGSFTDCASPFTLPELMDGMHNITVRAFDQAGNYKEDWVELLIDNTPPEPFTLTANPSTWANTPPIISFATIDVASGVAYYEIKLNSDSFTKQTSPYEISKLKDGVHNFTVRAYDYAGNYMDGFVPLYMDSNLPAVQVITPENNSWVNTSNPEITWEHSDTVSEVQRIELYLDEESPISLGNGTSYNFTDLAQGAHTLMIKVFDMANNMASQLIHFKVDSTTPLITITNPEEDNYFSLSYVSVTWIGSDSPSGIQFYEIKIDENEYKNTGATTARKLIGLSDGEHTAYIRAFDVAGNSDVATVVFLVDTTKPTLEVLEPMSGSILKTSTITCKWIGEDTISGIEQYEIKLDDGEYENLGKKTSHTFSGLIDGAHTIYIKATNNAGNSAEVQFTIEIDTTKGNGNGDGGINGKGNMIVIITTISLIVVLLIILLLFYRKKKRPDPTLTKDEPLDKTTMLKPPVSGADQFQSDHRPALNMPFITRDPHQFNSTHFTGPSVIQQPANNNIMPNQTQPLTTQQQIGNGTMMQPSSIPNKKLNPLQKNDDL